METLLVMVLTMIVADHISEQLQLYNMLSRFDTK